MSKKWKYAGLPANQRISLIRQGNSDVYNSEMERTRDVIKSREELGLDTSAQVKWADTLSYNYNLGNAERMGISTGLVDKTGYGARLTAGYTKKSSDTSDTLKPEKSSKLYLQGLDKEKRDNDRKIKEAYSDYKADAMDSFKNTASVIREDLINRGANINGGKMISEDIRTRAALADTLAKLDDNMQKALADNERYYEQLAHSYRTAAAKAVSDAAAFEAENTRWLAEYNLKKQGLENEALNEQNDMERWRAEYELDKQKESNDSAQWTAEHEFNIERENADNAKWQAEYDLDVKKEQNNQANKDREYELDKQKEDTDNAHWQAEYELDVEKQRTDYEQWCYENGIRY